MKVQELRIGNLLSYDGTVVQVSNIGCNGFETHKIRGILYGSCDLEDYDPIPLTEQWLIDFGFKHNPIVLVSRQYLLDIGRNRMLSFSDVGTPNFTVWLQSVEENKVTDLVCLHNWDYDKDMFVHQLQNLYFALTGEELQL